MGLFRQLEELDCPGYIDITGLFSELVNSVGLTLGALRIYTIEQILTESATLSS